MSKVVLEVIALIFQGVEGLILDLPAGPSTAHNRENVQFDDEKVRHPTKVPGFVLADFPILDKVHQ